MRLSTKEHSFLKEQLQKLSNEAMLYLFGSRVDDSKRGGDIDLLVVSKKLNYKDIRKLRVAFCAMFGEQKVDIVLDDGNFEKPFAQMIIDKAILL